MTKNEYKSPKYFKEVYDISSATLRSWGDTGKVRTIRLRENGARKYLVSDIERHLNVQSNREDRSTIIYARVSSSKQKEDLERQSELLQQLYPQHNKVITDIGSGVNFKRKGLQRLLELICDKMVDTVIVLYRDRLVRVGFDIFQQICDRFGTTIVVHNENEKDEDGEHDDLVAVITSFVASHHGKRASQNRKRRAQVQSEQRKDAKKAKAREREEAENEEGGDN